jgi:hypothetical protein
MSIDALPEAFSHELPNLPLCYDHRLSVTCLCSFCSFSSDTGMTDGRSVYFLDVGFMPFDVCSL